MLKVVLDVFCVFLILISAFSVLRRGFLVSIYNLVAMGIIVLSVLQIYPKFTDIVKVRIPVLPSGFGDFVSVGILFIGFMMIARLLRELLVFFIVMPEPAGLERFVAMLLGAITGIMSASMFMFWLYISPWDSVISAIEEGRLSRYLYILPAKGYTFFCDTLIRPYFKGKFTPNHLVYLEGEGKRIGGKKH